MINEKVQNEKEKMRTLRGIKVRTKQNERRHLLHHDVA